MTTLIQSHLLPQAKVQPGPSHQPHCFEGDRRVGPYHPALISFQVPDGMVNSEVQAALREEFGIVVKLLPDGEGGTKVLWLGSLLPRLLTTPNGSQWLPTTPDSSLRLQTHAVVV